MLLVALDVTSAPVVTITHSSCFAVTFLTIPYRPIMTSTDPFSHRPTADSKTSFSHIWAIPYTHACADTCLPAKHTWYTHAWPMYV